MRHIIFILLTFALSFSAFAEEKSEAKKEAKSTATKKKVNYRKTQEVNFDGSDIDGQVRSPDGAYLLQKRGVNFLPLYKVNNKFDKSILESVEYLR